MTRTKRQKMISKRRAAGKRAQTAPCPHPEKIPFPTEVDAERALGATWRAVGRSRYAVRVYRCECGTWHMTSVPASRKPKRPKARR